MGLAAFIATTVGKFVAVVIALVVAVGLAGAGLYAADYGFEATVVDKECRLGQSSVTLRPTVIPTEITQPMPLDQCGAIQPGNFVIYNIRSERVRIYVEEGGALLWDSQMTGQIARGPIPLFAP